MSFSPQKSAMALLFAVLPTLFVLAQNPQEAKTITKNYDAAHLQQMGNRFAESAQREKAAAVVVAQQRNVPVRMTLDDGGVAELQRVLPDGTLLYYRTNNVTAAKSTRADHLNTGGSLNLNLDGHNMTAGVWDGGHARVTHQEYDGPGGTDRVTIMDGPINQNFHAAHVAGTIMASGVFPQAKGMAPKAKVQAYDWNNDLGEATTAAGNGLLISNHSYGYRTDLVPDNYFGGYISVSRDWDALQYNAPYYLMVVAAGNDGTTNYNGFPLNPGLPQYDKLTGHTVAKNTLVVASAQDANVSANGDLISVNISSFSSQGPTDDLRIKPDITGNGHEVFSTFQASDSDYFSISGTSMASPNVTGTLLLLQEHANDVNGSFMRAATLKGLALHTADDAGMTGPDAIFGWGLLNAKRAAETLSDNGASTMVQELTLTQGQTYSITVEAAGFQDLMASISWTDPAGLASSDVNSPTAKLVNDLDVRVTQNANTYYPWRLTGVNTNSNGGDNNKDPFERVEVGGASGTYTITVTHKGTLTGGSQNFSLIVTGIQVNCTQATVPANIQVTGMTATTASLKWDMVPGALYDVRFRESGTTAWTPVDDIPQANVTLTGLTLLTSYEMQVRSECPGGTPTAYSPSEFFTTSGPTYCSSSSDNSLAIYHISNVSLNTINNTSTHSAYTDFTNISTSLEEGQTYTITITPTTNDPAYGVNYAVWIDYSNNGSFGEAGEQVFTFSGNAQNPASGQFTVPAGVNPGTTRMRVSLSNSGIPGPCDSFTHGEVEDYTIDFNADGYIYQNGVWSPADPSGIATTADNITVINGATVLTDATEAYNLYIQPGASLSVANSLKVSGDITNEGTLKFLSNATTTGQLDTFTGTLTGTVEVQRYIPARRAFRFLSSSVTTTGSIRDNWQEGQNNTGTAFPGDNTNTNPGFGIHISGSQTGANGFDATPGGNASLFTLNNAQQNWEAVTNTDSNTLTAGTPYRVLVRGDRSVNVTSNNATPTSTILRSTGTMHTGPFNITALSTVAGGFNFVGNPYQASVNMNDVIAASTNVNPAHYYVWDPTLNGNNGRGAYIAVELPTGTNAAGSYGNHYLQPGQAVFVRTLNNGAATINFQESHKDVTAPLMAVFSTDSRIDLRLYEAASFTAGNTPSDALRLKFATGNSNAITPQDAPKFYNQDENLASETEGNLYSIENRDLPQAGEKIQLFTDQYRHTNYMLEIEQTDVDVSGAVAYLRDHYNGTDTELINNDISLYAFQVDPNDPNSIAEDRFEIVFEDMLSTESPYFGKDFVLFPNPLQGDRFFIATRNLEGQKVSVEVHSLLGQSVVSHTETVGSNGRVEVNAAQLAAGMYIVTLRTEDGKRFTAKLINK